MTNICYQLLFLFVPLWYDWLPVKGRDTTSFPISQLFASRQQTPRMLSILAGGLKGQASMVTRSQEIYAYERCAIRDTRCHCKESTRRPVVTWYRADRTWKFNVWANIQSAWTKFSTRCDQTSSKLGSALVLNITSACWPLQVRNWNFTRKTFNLPNRPALPKPLSLRKPWFVTGDNFMSHRK